MIDVNTLNETPHLLDILLEIEDVVDSMDLYVFKNWIRGEVVFGPHITRYTVDIQLKYRKGFMPDPIGGMRLQKHGIHTLFDTTEEGDWLVSLKVPRKLISGLTDTTSEFYDDEIDLEDVDSAVDLGIDSETGYVK